MFLMFQLERPDVLAVGDLGVRRAVSAPTGCGCPTPPSSTRSPSRGARTAAPACRVLWRSLDNEPG